ncbi:acetyltransferase-like isoleucine patch superfamily enzyme [Methanococcus maripaludis]|uniref:Acetyltransferase-like isoleucine patch superfamily enzyme n=1 Tax=Methanococcus maripaludis TaxID=39152 RepID=A0A7J9NIM8_METMI|nr:CatB-related O-acetyltransferase [Methanococcus maripaludis]MBA2840764.1 acetyltransferase-like isoleucine patch superfamily enzyme [Methanococcus maripaludis]
MFLGNKYPKLSIGTGTYINDLKLYCWDNTITVNIGKYCSFASGISITAGGEHDIDWVSTYPFIDRWNVKNLYSLKKPRYKGDIVVGNDVWVGNNVTILSGVTIGSGAVIGACSVVTKDIPPYAVAVGNPCKIIKYRFDKETIEKLLKICWWDWDRKKIYGNLEKMVDTEKFVKYYGK